MIRPGEGGAPQALDEALVRFQLVERLRRTEPSAIAILVGGSLARGSADEDSDLDLSAITEGEPCIRSRTWLEERPGKRPLLVSAQAASVEDWLAASQRPQPWALGFPALYEARYVWTTEEARARLGGDPSVRHPPAPPQLEDFLAHVVKARRCARQGDGMGLRLFAHQAGWLAPGLLRPLNPERVVRGRRDALEAALALPLAPEHYRYDLRVCLGLVPAGEQEVEEAALRLGRELLAFLRERQPDVDPQPELPRYLADGTLERLLA
ncbi:MAG: hypothetical protein C4306_01160 [Thermoleophilia bacterium]